MNKTSFVQEVLKSLYHAIEERDWERLKEEEYQLDLEVLKKITETLTTAGYTCPPHALLEPSEVAKGLQKFIEEENAEKALACLSRLCLSLLEEKEGG